MKRKGAEVNLAEPNEKSSGGDPAQRLPGQPLLWPKGVVHMADFMPLEEQRGLLAAALRLGCATFGGFEVSHNERTKRMLMMHVGRRTQGPGRHPHAHVPLEWHTIAARVMAAARAQDASLPALDPIDVCVVNLYIAESRLSPHVDVLTIGDPAAPLVSLSLGLACDFCFQKNWGKKHKMHKVTWLLSVKMTLIFHCDSVLSWLPAIERLPKCG
jgi:alkylated DNA repair dioxygenase AlkB